MSNLIIEKLLAKTRRTDIPAFRPGDTVRVHVKIKEGDKERVQAFEGVVIKRDNGPQASFTVRKISFGQGVERIFPIHSKVIDKVDLVRSSKVRRARLFYLRGLKGKAARLRDVEKSQPHQVARSHERYSPFVPGGVVADFQHAQTREVSGAGQCADPAGADLIRSGVQLPQ